MRLEWRLFRDILKVGLLSAVGTVVANLTVVLATSFVAGFGRDAIAGYGLASRLDYLLIPLLFALGTASVTMVGMNSRGPACTRAQGRMDRRRISAAIAGVIGLVAALFPEAWLHLFSREEEVVRSERLPRTRRAFLRVHRPRNGDLLRKPGRRPRDMALRRGCGATLDRARSWRVLDPCRTRIARGLFWIVAMSQIAFGTINAFAMANRLTFKSPGTGHRGMRSVSSQIWPRRVLQEQERG